MDERHSWNRSGPARSTRLVVRRERRGESAASAHKKRGGPRAAVAGACSSSAGRARRARADPNGLGRRPTARGRHRRCRRSTPTSSLLHASAIAPAAASRTASTPTCWAELARTDMHRLRLLAPDSDETEGAADADPRPRRPGGAHGARSPTSCARNWKPSGPAPPASSGTSIRPIALAFLERYPSPEDARALGGETTGRVPRPQRLLRPQGAPASCSPACAPHPAATPWTARERSAPAGRTRARGRAAATRRADPAAHQRDTGACSPSIPTARSPLGLFRDPKSMVTAAELLAEIGDRRERHPTSSSLEAIAGQNTRRGRIRQEEGRPLPAGACNKTLCAAPSAVLADSSRKTQPLGQRHLPDAPAPAATTTHTPSASSAAPGCESSGASGTTKPLTTPPATAASTASSTQG